MNKDPNRQFTEEEIQTANKHVEMYPNSLVTKKRKLKQQYHFKLSDWQFS